MPMRGGRRRMLASAGLVLLALAASVGWPPSEALLGQGRVLSVRFTDRNGALLREWRPDGRGQPVALADVSPAVVKALVAVEDQRFYAHSGVDVRALGRALRDNAAGRRVVSGASTLTRQAARALRGEARRGVWSKLAEIHLAFRLEQALTK